jgi:hypothetical protein
VSPVHAVMIAEPGALWFHCWILRAAHVLALLAFAAALAGCGGRTSAQSTTTTRPAAPTLTSASDRAACNELESDIRIVSQLVSNSVEVMTQSLHPKELARRTGETQRNLLYAASVLSLIDAPTSLAPAQHRLVLGLKQFAADFGRAQRSVARNDIAKAARQLVDRPALANVAAATRTIDRACGA